MVWGVSGLWAGLLIITLLFGYRLWLRLRAEITRLEAENQSFLDQTHLLQLGADALQAGAWDYSPLDHTTRVTRLWNLMLGYAPREQILTTKDFGRLVHPDDQAPLIRFFNDYMQSGGKRPMETEFRLRHNDGTWRWMLCKGKAVAWDEKGNPTRIIGVDISIQNIKEAQQRLAQSEEKFRAIFDNSPYGITIARLEDGVLLEANKAFLDMRQISPDELHLANALDNVDLPDEAVAAIRDELVRTGRILNREVSVAGPDGGRRYINYSSVLLALRGENVVLSMSIDVTDQRIAEKEREKLKEQLLQAQKLEAVGTLAGGVAHDFNNMLGAIMGYAELSRDEAAITDDSRSNLESILDVARRSSDIVRQLLAFARKQTIEPVVFDLNESVENILKMIRRLIGENIELIWLPGNGELPVLMDPSQFDQIVVNLCVNAKDAIADVGRITIETGKGSFDDAYCAAHADFAQGDYAMLAISDNGCGMDHATMAHVFEPFFTTKGPGKGTGMGLATVYGIVRQHDGFVNVYSEPGDGTAFRIFIPLQRSEEVTKRAEPVKDMPGSRGETLLVVEDDSTLLHISIMMLQKLGYTVISAESPQAAIQIAENNTAEIHMVITDVIMPGMNGKELAARLQAMRPSMKCLFMSGYTADIIAHKGVLDKDRHFIQKPFALQDLAVKIRQVLD
ncbi:MAG: PAS domain-containing protein [Thermodesulfobacteriota bacterium]|nr:PAS domain-containing protein [Thermodesulfobacteriota bacterium]